MGLATDHVPIDFIPPVMTYTLDWVWKNSCSLTYWFANIFLLVYRHRFCCQCYSSMACFWITLLQRRDWISAACRLFSFYKNNHTHNGYRRWRSVLSRAQPDVRRVSWSFHGPQTPAVFPHFLCSVYPGCCWPPRGEFLPLSFLPRTHLTSFRRSGRPAEQLLH